MRTPEEIQQIRDLILLTNGRIFNVWFIKRGGEHRSLTGRLGVMKGITGAGLKWDPKQRNMMVVWDARKRDFRMVNLSTVYRFKCGKTQRFYTLENAGV